MVHIKKTSRCVTYATLHSNFFCKANNGGFNYKVIEETKCDSIFQTINCINEIKFSIQTVFCAYSNSFDSLCSLQRTELLCFKTSL